MQDGREILLYDRSRQPADWMDVMGPTQSAVFIRDRESTAPLSPAGRPYAKREDVSCLLFDRVDAAQQFCEALVAKSPHICCEILDAHGRTLPPLMVVTHPDYHADDDDGASWALRRKFIVAGLLLAAAPLLWNGAHSHGTKVLPTLLGLNCVLLAMRFLYWDFGVRNRERERLERLAAHRRVESGDA